MYTIIYINTFHSMYININYHLLLIYNDHGLTNISVFTFINKKSIFYYIKQV